MIVHFNATVTGYFTLPHKLFTSTLPLGIYLGDFGSSLFFIVSGASLALTVPAEQNPAQFYKRRARAVYPLFWLAWFVVFSYRFVAHPGSFGGARTVTLVLTLLGLDNFAVAAGWVGTDFACVGEWFLGSILFLYLLFPLLQRGLRKRPWLTWALTLAVCIQLYIRDLVGSTTRPVKELKGFQKIFLEPGQSEIVRFKIAPEMLRYYNYDLQLVAEPGEFEVMIGTNSRDVKSARFTLK